MIRVTFPKTSSPNHQGILKVRTPLSTKPRSTPKAPRRGTLDTPVSISLCEIRLVPRGARCKGGTSVREATTTSEVKRSDTLGAVSGTEVID